MNSRHRFAFLKSLIGNNHSELTWKARYVLHTELQATPLLHNVAELHHHIVHCLKTKPLGLNNQQEQKALLNLRNFTVIEHYTSLQWL